MVKIIKQKNTGTLSDLLFTKAVNIAQSTVIKSQVKKTSQTHFDRKGPRADENFESDLLNIGLRPEHLWWGPMTLFPRKAQFLIREIEKLQPKSVLDVGSGTSTLLLAALARKHNFEILSLENHSNTVEYVAPILDELSLGDEVTINLCGFVQRRYPDGKKYRWYDAALESFNRSFDFVLVDGPMGRLVGRNGAIPEIRPFLAKHHRIFLDDAQREHERQCVEEWRQYFSDIKVELSEQCFGIGILNFPD